MIISLKKKYIYIAVPKTGTTSIQKLLLANDPSARKNSVEIDEVIYRFEEHYTAKRIKQVLGDHYASFQVFGFIRNPYSRVVSSYYFYKNGEPITSGSQNPWPARLRIALARVMPFKLWCLIYPYKSNLEHLVDSQGQSIVTYIGTFENLREDLKTILKKIQVNIDIDKLIHSNQSKHENEDKYFNNIWFRKLIQPKLQKDLDFYNIHAYNLSGKQE